MIEGLLKLIGAEKGEESEVLLLLGNGFFMGIFLATYQVASETIFIFTFEGQFLEQAFVLSGLLGVVFTGIFGSLQSRWPFDRIAIFNTLFIILISGSIWLVQLNDNSETVSFISFVLLGPLTALVLLNFWGVFGRLFDLRQSKRIIGGIDTGQLLATILAFYTIPVFTTFVGKTEHLFLVSALSLLVSFVFLLFIIKNYNIHTYEKRSREELSEVGFRKILKNNYIIILGVFLMFSMAAFKFVDFAFLKTVYAQYDSEEKLADFLGPFNGTIMILSFLIQTFLNDKIIGDYGLKVALLVMPVILGFFTVIIVVVGSIFGIAPGAAGFGTFFLLISLSKLFITSLKDALENPAFKLFFLPFDTKIRFDIQAKVEGTMGQFSAMVAGGLTLLLTFLGFELISFSFVLLFIIAGLIFVIFRLYKEYKIALTEKLALLGGGGETIARNDNSVSHVLSVGLQSDNEREVMSSLLLADKLHPLMVERSITDFLKHPSESVRKIALRLVSDSNAVINEKDVRAALKVETIDEVKELSLIVLQNLKRLDDVSIEEIKELSNSADPTMRTSGAKFLRYKFQDEGISELSSLIRDQRSEVRTAALITVGSRKDPLLWQGLIDNLKLQGNGFIALNSIIEIGEEILPLLDVAFYKSGQSKKVLIKIINAYSQIGGEKAIALLLTKLDYPEGSVVKKTWFALSQCGFQVRSGYRTRLKNAIEIAVNNIAWNLAAHQEVNSTYGNDVKLALLEENEAGYEHIYMLLMMLFDDKSVLLVKDSVSSGSGDDLSFAVELLDIFLDEDLKPIVIPIIDDLSISERLNRLEIFFPRATYDEYDVLRQIINRDYNRLNIWTKACATYCLSQMSQSKVTDDLVANLYNPDNLLRQTSALVMNSLNSSEYQKHSQRLDPDVKKQLDYDITEIVSEKMNSLYERMLFIKSVPFFSNISSEFLLELADNLKETRVNSNVELIKPGQYSISPVFIVRSGSVKLGNKVNDDIILNPGDIFGNELILDLDTSNYFASTLTDSILFVIDYDNFFEMTSERFELVENIIKTKSLEFV